MRGSWEVEVRGKSMVDEEAVGGVSWDDMLESPGVGRSAGSGRGAFDMTALKHSSSE